MNELLMTHRHTRVMAKYQYIENIWDDKVVTREQNTLFSFFDDIEICNLSFYLKNNFMLFFFFLFLWFIDCQEVLLNGRITNYGRQEWGRSGGELFSFYLLSILMIIYFVKFVTYIFFVFKQKNEENGTF